MKFQLAQVYRLVLWVVLSGFDHLVSSNIVRVMPGYIAGCEFEQTSKLTIYGILKVFCFLKYHKQPMIAIQYQKIV